MIYRSLSSIFVLIVTLAQAEAQPSPQSVRGKSVTASWTETRSQRVGGQGEFVDRSFSQSLSVYVSETGRAFAKRTVTSNRGARTRSGNQSSVGENSGRGQSARVQGRSIFVTTQFAGGARLVKIDVDQSGTNCTASVVLGRENGQGIAVGKSQIDGRRLEIKSASVSAASCSIRAGNVFGE